MSSRPRMQWIFGLAAAFLAVWPAVLHAGDPEVSPYRWSDADMPLTYRMNVSKVPGRMQGTFIEYSRIGLDDWAKVDGAKLTSCYRGVTQSWAKGDEKIFARWNELPTGIGGWAYYPPVGYVEYNVRYADAYFRDRDNLRNLTLHENGHAIGFPHYFEEESVMAYKFIPQLTAFDLALIRLNYPGEKITSEACCAKSDTSLASTGAFRDADAAANGRWCYASWLDHTVPISEMGISHEP
ncbi:hypothetical protein HY522_01265 [bacterium]|nr:hypothetical protein [bacterium]